MGALNDIPAGLVSLDSVLCTAELKRRPKRSPDYQAESQALRGLAKGLTNSPEHVLQELVDLALVLCHGHSAGISLLEQGDPGNVTAAGDHFRWHAVAGQWAPLAWSTTTPRNHGLVGMRFRVEAEGGSLTLQSAPGTGTLIRVSLPAATPVLA